MSGTTKSTSKSPAMSPRRKKAGEPIRTSFGTTESMGAGRTRIRVNPELRSPEAMAQIQAQLEKHKDVMGVTVDQRTGSIVVEHHPRRAGHRVLREALKDVELAGGIALDIPVGEDEGEGGGDARSKLDQSLADTVYQFDKWLYKRTGLRLHGEGLAASIAGLGVVQIFMVGITWELIPGPMLMYIGYDVYRRTRKEPPLGAPNEISTVSVGPKTDGDATDDVAP